MRDLIEYMAKWIVDEPDAIRVQEFRRGPRTVVRLTVDQQDMGRIIGREGRLASAMRTLLTVAGEQRGRQTSLEIR